MYKSAGLLLLLALPMDAFAEECLRGVCVNTLTNAGFKGFSRTPVYQINYPTTMIPASDDCGTASQGAVSVPRGSYFRLNSKLDSSSESTWVVDVYQVPVTNQLSASDIQSGLFSSPMKVCLIGHQDNVSSSTHFVRRGGFHSGLLAVPFKYRKDGDLEGDAALGPYLAYRWESFDLLTMAGYTKVALFDRSTGEKDTEDGLSVAVGVGFRATKSMDVSFLAGWDWLGGRAGDEWEHQGEPWIAFGVGYKFGE